MMASDDPVRSSIIPSLHSVLWSLPKASWCAYKVARKASTMVSGENDRGGEEEEEGGRWGG